MPDGAAVPFYSEQMIGALLRYGDLIPAMERALADFSSGRVLQPVRSVVPIPEHDAFFGLMPAVYGDLLGAKFVTVFPGNARKGLPTHQALIALFDSQTGEPQAILDGRLITEMRTAAVSAAAVKLLSPPEATILAVLGSGVQAYAHVEALRQVRRFSEIRVWSRTPEHARRFATAAGASAMSPENAVGGPDVVVAVTNSPVPVLHGRWLKSGALVCAVGAVGAERRELDTAAMQGAVVVDSRAAAKQESGDLLLAKATIYAELGEIFSGARPVPRAQTIVFKSLGLAVEDLAAAGLVLSRASANSQRDGKPPKLRSRKALLPTPPYTPNSAKIPPGARPAPRAVTQETRSRAAMSSAAVTRGFRLMPSCRDGHALNANELQVLPRRALNFKT